MAKTERTLGESGSLRDRDLAENPALVTLFWGVMAISNPQTSERGFIALLRSRAGRAGTHEGRRGHKRAENLIVGIGDDGAVLDVPRGQQLVVTTDFSLEDVHFRRDSQSPEAIGHRCLARGLSDLAAMGARPLAAFLSLALPEELTRSLPRRKSWRDRFLDGLLALAKEHQVPLAGGDTAKSPQMGTPTASQRSRTNGLALADIVLIGIVARGQALLRSGAKPGDRIYVTGQLGGAAAELRYIERNTGRLLVRKERAMPLRHSGVNPHPHLFPRPRIDVGRWLLRNRRATAATDISDGFSTDLDHICEESGLSATIEAALLPIHPLALRSADADRENAIDLALHGGEDYELLFTASPRMHVPRQIAGVPVTHVGTMRRPSKRKSRMMLIGDVDGAHIREHPLLPMGWEHFR